MKIEEKTIQQKDFLETIIKSSVDGILAFDCNCCYTVWNPGMERISGMSAEEVVGQYAFDVFPFLKEIGEDKCFYDALDGNVVTSADREYQIPATGRHGIFQGTYSPLPDAEGVIVGGLAIIHEITELKRIEEGLRDSESQLRNLFEHLPVAIAVSSMDGKLLAHNEAFVEVTKYTPAELKGINVRELYENPDDRDQLIERLKQGDTRPAEIPLRQKGGASIIVNVTAAPLSFEGNDVVLSTVENITERRRAEAEIRVLNEQLVGVMDGIDALLYVCDMDTYEVLYINKYGRDIWGDLVGKTCWKTIQKGMSEPCDFCTNDRLIDENGRSTGPCVWQFQNTVNHRWYECRDQAIPWEDGRLVRMEIATDITDRKRTEEALLAERERASNIIDGTNAGTWDWNVQTGELALNERWAEIIGYTLEELEPTDTQTWADSVHPEDRATTNTDLKQYLEGEEDYYDVEFRQLHKDGGCVWIHACGKIVERTGEGKPLRMSGTHLDITNRKLAEVALRESESSLMALIEGVQAAIVVHDSSGKITLSNQTARRLLAYLATDLDGRELSDPTWCFFHEDGTKVPVGEYPVSRILKTKEAIEGLLLGLREAHGSKMLWLLVNAMPVIDEKGDLSRVIVSFMDITKRKQVEEQIAATLKEKEVLLREIHHRVKNNMQVIVSLLRMHSRRIKDTRLGEIFDECRDRVNAMGLIHEALYQSEDMARIDFKAYLKKLCRDLSRVHDAPGKGIALTVEQCSVVLNMDQGIAVGMVICELISNAFKYAFPSGEGGSVSINLSNRDEEIVELIVQDNGIGLPEGMDALNSPSLGLQLAVATVTDELGGSIEVERDDGTRFIIRFKCKTGMAKGEYDGFS